MNGRPGDVCLSTASGKSLTYLDVSDMVSNQHEHGAGRSGALTIIFATATVEVVVSYLSVIVGSGAVMLVSPELAPAAVSRILARFCPDYVVAPPRPPKGYVRIGGGRWARQGRSETPVHADLGLVLLTSGTMGAPKGVCLSRKNLLSNSLSIVETLRMTSASKAISGLPLHYTYGLSVLNTHLLAGGEVFLTDTQPSSIGLYAELATNGITHLAGVPMTYEVLSRQLERYWPKTLNCLTQSGGRLSLRLQSQLADLAKRNEADFYVMYGQTEATARISAFNAVNCPGKLGSVGVPLPNVDVSSDTTTNEIVVAGDGVMLGYATNREELGLVDARPKAVYTGDTGHVDPDGFIWLTGRIGRITKISGRRVSLDEIEEYLSQDASVAAVADRESILIYPVGNMVPPESRLVSLARHIGVPRAHIRVYNHAAPILANGKIDYASLRALASNSRFEPKEQNSWSERPSRRDS